MVAGPGVAPRTEDYESSVILFHHPAISVERDGRIELPTLAWKAKVIPFYESRKKTGAVTTIFT